MASKKEPDYLFPFDEAHNRNEIFVVEYDGVLKNFNESILRKLIIDYQRWEHKYPLIKDYLHFSSDELYEFSINVDTVTMLSTLKHDKKTSDKDRKDIENDIKLLYPINVSWLHTSRMQIALFNILDSKIVKRMYIVNKNMDEELRKYIASSIPNKKGVRDKISLVNGSISEVVQDHPEVTTVILRRSQELYDMTKHFPDKLKNKLFIVNDTIENMAPDKYGNLSRKYYDYFDKFQTKYHCNIFYAFPSCVSDTRLDAKG